MRYRLLFATLLVVFLGASTFLVCSTSAFANGVCNQQNGSGCDHQAPQSTQNLQGQLCSSGASDAIAPVYGNGWTLELRWGPYCSTNWARFGGGAITSCFDIEVVRQSDGATDHATGCGYQDGIWTNQLFAPGAARACVRFKGILPWSSYGSWGCTDWTPNY